MALVEEKLDPASVDEDVFSITVEELWVEIVEAGLSVVKLLITSGSVDTLVMGFELPIEEVSSTSSVVVWKDKVDDCSSEVDSDMTAAVSARELVTDSEPVVSSVIVSMVEAVVSPPKVDVG